MRWLYALALAATAGACLAQDYPQRREGSWVVRDFRFHTGEVLPELRLNYTTVGAPSGEPVVLLHGTTGSGAGLLSPAFGAELLGAGQPLDATRYFVILPDAIGHARYNYDDMVDAHQRLIAEHFGIKRVRLVLGNSMGGMQTWIWAQKYPRAMDVAVPMASLPAPMAGRNWMTRRLIIDSIRRDPGSAQFASVFYAIATNGGNQALHRLAPTREKADQLLDARLKAPFAADPDDVLYQWDSSRDYDPSAGLERIQATLLAINSADDERNPPELGILDREIKRVKNARALLIPGGPDTAGHGTTGQAKFWKKELAELLQRAPRLAD